MTEGPSSKFCLACSFFMSEWAAALVWILFGPTEVNTTGDITTMGARTIDSMTVLVLVLVLALPRGILVMVLVGMDMIGHTEEMDGIHTIHTNMFLVVVAVEEEEGEAIHITFPIFSTDRPCPLQFS